MKLFRSLVVVLSLLPTAVLAWGDIGHLTICELAMSQVTPVTKSAILKITGNQSWPLQCIWPDQVKRYGAWTYTQGYHFINLEAGSGWTPTDKVKSKKDGKIYAFPNVGDMVQMIEHSKDRLMDKGLTANQKLCHLRFLGHLTGDSHQPLHSGRKADAGGNAIAVSFNGDPLYNLRIFALKIKRDDNGEIIDDQCSRQIFTPSLQCMMNQTILEKKSDGSMGPLRNNLHILWDDTLIDQRVREAGGFTAERFENRTSDESFQVYYNDIAPTFASRGSELRASMSDDTMRWLEITSGHQAFAYDTNGLEHSEEFYKSRLPVVNDQIIRAGYHLAGTLNMIFDPSVKVSPAIQSFIVKRKIELDARIKAGRSTVFKTACDESL